MNRIIIIYLGILILYSNPASSYSPSSDSIQLNLRKGDQFTYTLKSTNSYITKLSEKDTRVNSEESYSRLKFIVEDIPGPGCYIITCKKQFTIVKSVSQDSYYTIDSRFPSYSSRYEDMAASFLSTVKYKILFCPSEHEMQIMNFEEIRQELIKYLESRGVPKERNTTKAAIGILNEKRILAGLGFLNFYPSEVRSGKNWQIEHLDGFTENFMKSGKGDSIIYLVSEIPDYTNRSSNRYDSPAKTLLKKNMRVHAETGLLLGAESYSILTDTNIETDKIFRKNPDVTDYKIEVELASFSRWQSPTILSGQLERENVSALCLVSKSNMIGSDEEFQPIDLNNDGNFSIQLNIDEPMKYRLYFVEKFPTKNNQNAHLFIEPGDSIFISTKKNDTRDTIIFSGKGYHNSQFLNQHHFSRHVGIPLYIIFRRSVQLGEYLSRFKKIKSNAFQTKQSLELNKEYLSEEFYTYMESEIQSINLMLEGYQFLYNLRSDPENLRQTNEINQHYKLPDYPEYVFYENLEHYDSYIELYSLFRFTLFQTTNHGRTKFSTDHNARFEFSKLLYDGYPLYLDLGNQLERFLKIPTSQFDPFEKFFINFFEACNNEQTREYFREQYTYYNKLKPGNPAPTMNLIDINGEKLDWDKTKGKVVVLMLYKGGGREHQFGEVLYEEYDKKRDEAIIMRISTDLNYTSWRSFNTRYSEQNYQYFFEGGEYEFNDRFLFSINSNPKYLVIGRDGNIFQNVSGINYLKGAIRSAIDQEPPAGKEFVHTIFAKILLGIFIGIILSILLYRLIIYRSLKKKALVQKMTELEQRALKAQLNPHFLFNCLNSIQHLIRSNKRSEADKYLTTFATLIRQMLSNSEKENVSISEELESLKNYLELEQMRFNFEFEIMIDDQIDIFNTMIPTMLLQPVVENAILHGLDQKTGSKKLKIEAHLSNNSIQFSVDDNGVGRSISSKSNKGHESKGLKIIESRIALLNKSGEDNYQLQIIDKKDNTGKSTGTNVVITLPDEL